MASTALLVIDMQNVFASMTTTALPHIESLIRRFRAHAPPVIFTQHGHSEEELTGPPYSNQLVQKWGPDGSIRTGSHDWELQAPILELVGEAPVVAKNTYDAFINTNLEALLKGAGVTRVVVCGVMTDCCCDTTARSAFNRGWETWLVRDACGSASKAQHEAGLRAYGFAFGDVISTEEVVQRLHLND